MKPTVWWETDRVIMIDQRLLPKEERYLEYRTHEEVAEAITTMVIRGAPAIGVAAAFGMVLGARQAAREGGLTAEAFERVAQRLAATRPTAVNLFWAVERMKRRFQTAPPAEREKALLDEALAIEEEDLASCRKIGDLGAELLPAKARVLTHCNAGAL